ncbi:hypothetical protein ACFV0T_23460 [Streptomyces sp. NPDC059582]|uniref:hypothetical protein n=1 Tax=Streptomyces sp. NPDC059582 TaxID=3346875 RepID=UPI0036AAB64E
MTKFGTLGRVVATTTLLVGATVAAPAIASASANAPASCGTDSFITIEKYGTPYYRPIGTTAGKYNAGETSTLRYAIKTTTSRSTSWTVGGSASVGWGIAKVEAKFDHNVTKKTTKGITVTDTLKVKSKNYGYVTPKVEYRRFNIRKEHYGANCKIVVNQNYGVIDVIWTNPFFSECVSKHSCTPKP